MINRAGEKIAPREIDEVLLSHPAVAEAVAFGFPHPALGEEVAAAVVLRTPEASRPCSNSAVERLAEFKCPKKLHIIETHSAHGDRKNAAPCGGQSASLERGGMKFLIAGAGAIGAYMGACMARAGLDVTLFARGPHLRAMQERGVRVESGEGELRSAAQDIRQTSRRSGRSTSYSLP